MVSETTAEFAEIAASLTEMELLGQSEAFQATRLSGGVSCDVWRVDLKGGPICVKRALPKLRVEADWRAPLERAGTEVDWYRLVAGIDPRRVPEVLGENRARHVFAMEYLPPESHPLWKTELAAGKADTAFAAHVGEALAHTHTATAGREDIAHDFAHGTQFHALRLEPYLLHTAKKHPDVAPRIRTLAQGVADARIALMQGDISPKNILRGPAGPVFLDAECAWWGDPAFDLAFCLNHLLLKCLWTPAATAGFLACFDALAAVYVDRVLWEPPAALEARAAHLLPGLFLARVDGKSPVEYITTDADKDRVRRVARALLRAPPTRLDAIRQAWTREFAT